MKIAQRRLTLQFLAQTAVTATIVIVVMSVAGCLTRRAEPDLPYIKPAQSGPQVNQAQVHLVSRVEAMEQEIQRLRDLVERLQHSAGNLQGLGRLEQRVARIEQQLGIAPSASGTLMPTAPADQSELARPTIPGASPNATPPPPNTSPRADTRPISPPPPPGADAPAHQGGREIEIRNKPIPEDEKAFREGYRLLQQGKYADAENIFAEFTSAYPQSMLTPKVLYWMGEAQFAQGKYDEAVLQFDRVITEFPGSNKEADALLKQGQAFEKMGDAVSVESAVIIYEQLIQKHPHTAQARKAKKLLGKLLGDRER